LGLTTIKFMQQAFAAAQIFSFDISNLRFAILHDLAPYDLAFFQLATFNLQLSTAPRL